MLLTREYLAAMLLHAASVWRENTGLLGDIDSRFGDGDHGVTIGKIAGLFVSKVDAWKTESIKEFLENLGAGIMAIGGGSAGPLYGSLVSGLAEPLGDEDAIDAALLKVMLAGSLASLADLTTAKKGDKTMMDALIPAVDAARKTDGDIPAILQAAAEAAEAGAAATEGFVSKFGRARSYGEKTLGTRDAGAVSTALLFRGLCEGYKP